MDNLCNFNRRYFPYFKKFIKSVSSNGILDFGYSGGGTSWIQATNIASLGDAYNLLLNPNGGNVLIGTTTDNGYKLAVNGNIFSNSNIISNSFMTDGSSGQFSLSKGNGDAASFDICTGDIRTWYGFGIIGMAGNLWGDGSRTIVFDALDKLREVLNG